MHILEWMKKPFVVWLCIIFLPPLGLALAWVHPEKKPWAKLAGTVAAFLCAWIHLGLFWNMRVEGNCYDPVHYCERF